jgi:hypothetical protein
MAKLSLIRAYNTSPISPMLPKGRSNCRDSTKTFIAWEQQQAYDTAKSNPNLAFDIS